MRKALLVVGLVLGVFLIVRAVGEPLTIDFSDPATSRPHWAGRIWQRAAAYSR